MSLPTRNNNDPYRKEDRHRANSWTQAELGTVGKVKKAWMTQGQQSRYLKIGGVLFFLGLLLFLLATGGERGVGDLVKSLLS